MFAFHLRSQILPNHKKNEAGRKFRTCSFKARAEKFTKGRNRSCSCEHILKSVR